VNFEEKNDILQLNDQNHCKLLINIYITKTFFFLISSDTPVNSSTDSSSQLVANGHHSLNHQEQSTIKVLFFFLP